MTSFIFECPNAATVMRTTKQEAMFIQDSGTSIQTRISENISSKTSVENSFDELCKCLDHTELNQLGNFIDLYTNNQAGLEDRTGLPTTFITPEHVDSSVCGVELASAGNTFYEKVCILNMTVVTPLTHA